jgi:hypothetical protein
MPDNNIAKKDHLTEENIEHFQMIASAEKLIEKHPDDSEMLMSIIGDEKQEFLTNSTIALTSIDTDPLEVNDIFATYAKEFVKLIELENKSEIEEKISAGKL